MNHRNLSLISALVFFCVALAGSVSAQTWTQTTGPTNTWTALAMSADGTKLVAVGGIQSKPAIYTSADYGASWVSNTVPGASVLAWSSVAASADGTKLVAVESQIGVFTNSGTTWALAFTPGTGSSFQYSQAVASSANGTKLVLVDTRALSAPPGIYASVNSGASWASVTNCPNNSGWTAVASSADGSHLVATRYGAALGGAIYTSANAGTLWVSNAVPSMDWNSVASSASGSTLLATATPLLFASVNGGTSWAQVPNMPGPVKQAVCSTNGNIWFAIGSANGKIYSSVNAGASWSTNTANQTDWSAIAISADGSRGVAASVSSGIYILGALPPPPLTATLLKTNLISLLWSTNFEALGVGLQENTNLLTTNWVAVPGTPIVTNKFFELTLPATNRQHYFRLK